MVALEVSKEAGVRLRQSLEEILQRLPEHADTKLVEGVSKCFGRGHPLPEETSLHSTILLMEDFLHQLRKDPTRRQFVVDRDSLGTDDAAWLTLAGLAPTGCPLQWSITTTRSLERCVYDHCYDSSGWKIQHSTGPRGSAVVTKRLTSLTEEGCHQAFFSDTPKFVVATASQLGALYPDQIVVRVLRTAPRASLTQGLTRVVQNQPNLTDNVFTLWIRHHEKIEDLPGLGRYRYGISQSQNKNISVLDLLTDILEDQDDSEKAVSPLAHDFVLASQASLQRCNPAKVSTTSSQAINSAFTFENIPKVSDMSVEALNLSSPVNSSMEDVRTDRLAESPEKTTSQNVGEQDASFEEKKEEIFTDSEQIDDLCTVNQSTPCPAQKKSFCRDQERHPLFSMVLSPQPLKTETSVSPTPYSVSTIDTNQLDKDNGCHSSAVPYSVSTINTDEVEHNDLEIRPSFSFDEEDASTIHCQGHVTEMPECGTPTVHEVACEDENSMPEVKVDVGQLVSNDTEGVSTGVENVTNDHRPDSSNQGRKTGIKYVHCVGCRTNKTKSEFSKNQLRKKKNARCTDCVRDNRLGVSNE